jgi:hypothetical protein
VRAERRAEPHLSRVPLVMKWVAVKGSGFLMHLMPGDNRYEDGLGSVLITWVREKRMDGRAQKEEGQRRT